MKKALLLLTTVATIGLSDALAQITSISVETYYTDDASVADYPANHTTYRIYANCTNPNDAVALIYGDAKAPLELNVTGSGIWNHPAAGASGPDNNCNFYSTIPALEFDSYLTIGRTCLQSPGGLIYSAQDPAQPFYNLLFNTIPYGSIDELILNTTVGGGWYSIPQDINSHAGDGLKVLVAQITTDGDICGIFNFQVFPNWQAVGDEYIIQTGLPFGTADCVVAVSEVKVVSDLKVFPNPTSDLLNINFNSSVQQQITLFVTNNLGQTVKTERLGAANGAENLQLDVSNLSTGIYSIHLSNGLAIQTILVEVR
jgi:Secretion system C-terminal sorting domain